MKVVGKYISLVIVLVVIVIPFEAQESTDCDEGFWLFDHERLVTDPVCVPENPQRVVSLDISGTEFLLLNDIPIVGVNYFSEKEISALTPKLAGDLQMTTTIFDPSLELVAELEPDIIIAFQDNWIDPSELAQIAPLVIYDPTNGGNWKTSTEFWSEVFQKEETFASMMETYEARIRELQILLGEDRSKIKVSLYVPTAFRIWLQNSAPGHVLQDVGLGRPESQIDQTAEEDEGSVEYQFRSINYDQFHLADGDVIFIFSFIDLDPDVAAANRQLLENFHNNDEEWNTLNAVKTGNVHIVGGHWYRAATYLSANFMLDDLFTYLTDGKPTIPNPANVFIQPEVTEEPAK